MGAIPTEPSIIVRTIRGLVTPVRRSNSRMPRIALLWWGRAGAAALAMVAWARSGGRDFAGWLAGAAALATVA